MPLNEPLAYWILVCLAMGFGATLAIDLWAQLLKYSAGIPPTDWGLVGRWFSGLPRGRFRLQAGQATSSTARERHIGWTAHYAIGISYAFIYIGFAQMTSMPVSLPSALAFGLATVLAPWLILLPGLGKGWFAKNTPNPSLTRFLNIVVHLLFGAGLYLVWHFANTPHLF